MAATVKLSADGNILLKNGRVSCTCCAIEPGCCYYGADQFGTLWLEQDLPSAMRFAPYGNNTTQTVTVFRSGTTYGPHSFGGGYSQKYQLDLVGDSYRWRFYEDAGEGWQVSENVNCLFQDEADDGAWLLDDFEDTYNVEVFFETLDPPSAGSFTITRQGLCEWSGSDPTIVDGLVTLGYEPQEVREYKWIWLNAGGPTRIDAGPYNSPIGIYQEANLLYVVS